MAHSGVSVLPETSIERDICPNYGKHLNFTSECTKLIKSNESSMYLHGRWNVYRSTLSSVLVSSNRGCGNLEPKIPWSSTSTMNQTWHFCHCDCFAWRSANLSRRWFQSTTERTQRKPLEMHLVDRPPIEWFPLYSCKNHSTLGLASDERTYEIPIQCARWWCSAERPRILFENLWFFSQFYCEK